MNSMNSVETFIKAVREADKLNEMIYANGGCYQFYNILNSIF